MRLASILLLVVAMAEPGALLPLPLGEVAVASPAEPDAPPRLVPVRVGAGGLRRLA